ncbi:MAG: hypothetical protein NDJ90_14680 [Oligoflexia bacterium]|nr:hypothetical protein [Oligoflexia bacterium]
MGMTRALYFLNSLLLFGSVALAGVPGGELIYCTELYEDVANPGWSRHKVKLTENPQVVLDLFSGRRQITNEELIAFQNKEFLKTMRRVSGELDPKSRYGKATAKFYSIVPQPTHEKMLKAGPLRPISVYVEKITVAKDGTPLAKPVEPYKIINGALSDPGFEALEKVDPELHLTIRQLDRALSWLPPVEGVVYRGATLRKSDLAEISKGHLPERLRQRFVSTSTNISDALGFIRDDLFSQNDEIIPTVMIIQTRNGRMTSLGTGFAHEEEILIPRGFDPEIVRSFRSYPPPRPDEEAREVLYLYLR